jgi:hypothetical protein
VGQLKKNCKMGYCPYICIKCEQIQDNGWEYLESYEIAKLFDFSHFNPNTRYFEADADTRELLPDYRLWFEDGECLEDGTELTEENGYQLSFTVCSTCYSKHLQLEQFDLQHN